MNAKEPIQSRIVRRVLASLSLLSVEQTSYFAHISAKMPQVYTHEILDEYDLYF